MEEKNNYKLRPLTLLEKKNKTKKSILLDRICCYINIIRLNKTAIIVCIKFSTIRSCWSVQNSSVNNLLRLRTE